MNPILTFGIGLFIGGLVVYLNYTYNQDHPVDLNDKLITNQTAFEMINSFQQENTIQENVSVISGHLPIDKLLGYIALVDEMAKGKTDVSGLEVYFAKYGTLEQDTTALTNQKTFVIYPTYANEDGKHKAFDPTLSRKGNIVEIETLRANPSGLTTEQAESSVALNRSNMVPPRWN